MKWNYLKSQRAFVFSETNFLKNKNYHSLLLMPISFESEFFFYLNFPAMFYSGMLVEKYLGPKIFIGLYLANAVISGLTKVFHERQIGYRQVQRRGRMANNNGNISLFFMAFFSLFRP